MPRIQVYLPDELYKQVKKRRLPASELLQRAVRAEVRRLDQMRELDSHLRSLAAEVGEPTADEVSMASKLAKRIARRRVRRAS